ncbi:cellulose biosynthesis cyclic di-GMP-binding regulatory protein BcsB [Paenibacillus agaridevorans]|uniref:cellulose biosynthesis cyclic di-GMP-binding regulatory protein BcsB n=1 Tax=Paenibacillus agaridevorans TaxID=171404 RepID=UPI001BE414BB|nr:cellulose biosynthesis cyclic di-GMP-binding regulatory protein BcsB [Paenibacillus agaridevorans]
MRRTYLAVMSGAALALMLIIAPASSQASAERYSVALFAGDVSLRGTFAYEQSYFEIPDYWNVDSISLRLDYRATPLAIKEQSSVTLLINGTPFHSFRPVVDGDSGTSLQLDIPNELLVQGSNQLTIQGGLRTRESEKGCVVEDVRDNWLHVLQTSAVDIDYEAKPPNGSIRDFYHRFTGVDAGLLDNRFIVLPDDPDIMELETAAHILSGFARASASKEETIPLVSYSDNNWRTSPLVVFVSLREHLPSELHAEFNGLNNGEARIQIVESAAGHVLVATSDDPELLVKAGRLLANEDLAYQLNGKVKTVSADTDVDTPPVSVNRSVRLTETGDKLVGEHHQARHYFVALPANRSIAESSKIRLDFRYAGNLDFSRSLVTILINDKPVGSKKLSEERADGDSITLPIPKNLLVTGNFTATAAFDLELPEGYCVQSEEQNPWAFVSADSEMQLNTLDRTELLLDNYPYPFLRDGLYHKTAVIVPKTKDRYVLSSIAGLFSLLGQYAEGNTGELAFYDDDADPAGYRDGNVVVIGTYKDNELIRGVNDQLFFRFGVDGGTVLSNEKKTLDPDYGSRIGTLQLLESPWTPGNGLLAITGSKGEDVLLAIKLLTSESQRWRVSGDAVLTDRDGVVEPYRFKPEKGAVPVRTFAGIVEREDTLAFVTAASLVLVLVLLSLALLARKYRKNRGGGNGT